MILCNFYRTVPFFVLLGMVHSSFLSWFKSKNLDRREAFVQLFSKVKNLGVIGEKPYELILKLSDAEIPKDPDELEQVGKTTTILLALVLANGFIPTKKTVFEELNKLVHGIGTQKSALNIADALCSYIVPAIEHGLVDRYKTQIKDGKHPVDVLRSALGDTKTDEIKERGYKFEPRYKFETSGTIFDYLKTESLVVDCQNNKKVFPWLAANSPIMRFSGPRAREFYRTFKDAFNYAMGFVWLTFKYNDVDQLIRLVKSIFVSNFVRMFLCF